MTRDRSTGAGQHLCHSGKSLLVHSRGRAAKSRTDMTEIMPLNFTVLPACRQEALVAVTVGF